MLDDLFIVIGIGCEVIHLHNIESGIGEDEFVSCTVHLSDGLGYLYDLDAFH